MSIAAYFLSFPDGGFSHISFVDSNLSQDCYDSLRGGKAYELGNSPEEVKVRDMLVGLSVKFIPGEASGGTYDVRINDVPATREQWNPPPRPWS
jgi:hypothetical protein